MTDSMDAFTDRDWADIWDDLPEAPELVPRIKTSQITLRISSVLMARIKRVAQTRTLPYHALARSWLIDAVSRPEDVPDVATDDDAQSEQLNIKLDQAILDGLKKRAHEAAVPYHRFAREWLAYEAESAEAALGLRPIAETRPSLRELMMYLLHATDRQGKSAIEGATRLQKLMFVVEQTLGSKLSFYAYNYGPFNEELYDEVEALRIAGFLKGSTPTSSTAPSFEEMRAVVAHRDTGDRGDALYVLTDEGHEKAEELRQSGEAHEKLYQLVASVREDWDTPSLQDLIDRVYEIYPKSAEKSLIKDQVAKRNRRRHKDE